MTRERAEELRALDQGVYMVVQTGSCTIMEGDYPGAVYWHNAVDAWKARGLYEMGFRDGEAKG